MAKFGKLKLFSFLFPFLAVVIIFALMGVYPAGERMILTVDLYHQYMPFLYELRAKILEGRSLFYSWNGGLGNEFYAVFANYCASPLNLLCLLFPYKALPVFVAFITAVRAGLASLFMAMLLSHIDSRKYDLITVSFGVAYALSGWFLTDFWNIMWCDAYVLLPLICLGLLKLFTEGKYLLYIVSLAVALISNYYSGYMLCIFLTFFSVVMYFAFMPEGKLGPGSFFASAGRFALGSIIAGAISAVVIIPTYIVLQHSSATGDTLPVDFTPTGNLFDFMGRFMVSANPNIRDGLANVACGTVVVLMLPLFFMASPKSSITLRKKIGFGFMMLLMYLSFEMRTLNFIWHGFHFPNQIPYRQSYMMSFLAVIIAFMTIRVLKTFTPSQISAVCVGAGLFLVLYEKFGTGNEGYQQIGLSLLFLIIQSVVLRYIVTSTRTGSTVLEWVLMITMLSEALTASAFTIGRVADHEGFTGYEFYGKNRRTIHEYVNDIEGSEGHYLFERTEMYPNLICDIQSVYDVKGLSIFSSTARESFVKYMRNFGFHNNGINGLRNAGLTRVTASVLGVRNLALIQETQTVPRLFDVSYTEGDVTIYDNPDALPVGYIVSDDIIDYAPNSAITDVFVKTNDWIRAMGVQADVYLPVTAVSSDEEGMTATGRSGNALTYQINAAGSESSYTVTVNYAEQGADVYLYADSSKGGRVKIMNGIETVAEYEIRSYQTICLGTYTGEPLTAVITYRESPAGALHVYAYELNKDGYEQAMAQLGARPFIVTSYDDCSITGTIDAGDGGFMLLTIPYTEGFVVEVDGQKTELVSVQDALCGINLGPGTHDVVIRYVPEGFTQAAFISLAGIVALIVVCIIRKLTTKSSSVAVADCEVTASEDILEETLENEDETAD